MFDPVPSVEDLLGCFIEHTRTDLARVGLIGAGKLSFHAEADEAVPTDPMPALQMGGTSVAMK